MGDPRFGAAVARDRGSSLEHLGISFPTLRARVKQGFSFYELGELETLAVWDHLWRTSPYGDVLLPRSSTTRPASRNGPTLGSGPWFATGPGASTTGVTATA